MWLPWYISHNLIRLAETARMNLVNLRAHYTLLDLLIADYELTLLCLNNQTIILSHLLMMNLANVYQDFTYYL